MPPARPLRRLLALALLLAAACTSASSAIGSAPTASTTPSPTPPGPSRAGSPGADLTKLERAREQIEHLIFIVQENRSFDHYFGTFPGAEGIPTRNGRPTVCVPDPVLARCVPPYPTRSQLQEGGPHGQAHSQADVNGGAMDGFVQTVVDGFEHCADHRADPGCASYLGPQGQPDVMSYHTKATIPNYWTYAKRFVLQDHLFAPEDSWTLPAHLFLISAWAARCEDPDDPMSCTSNLGLSEELMMQRARQETPIWAWTDITYLLHEQGVSWAYYVGDDTCFSEPCERTRGREHTMAQQNPLPWFTTIRQTHQVRNIRGQAEYFEAAAAGDLPSVSWVMPYSGVGEHPSNGEPVWKGCDTSRGS
jgi:phospholipase C